jgi:hypothetical protein
MGSIQHASDPDVVDQILICIPHGEELFISEGLI